jgi:hypothetical protein
VSLLIPDIEEACGHAKAQSVPWFVRLWAAVVRRAAVDWVLYKEHSSTKLRKIGGEADFWIFKEEETKRLSSFASVCDILGLEVALVRRKITGLSEEDARKLRGMEFGDDW